MAGGRVRQCHALARAPGLRPVRLRGDGIGVGRDRRRGVAPAAAAPVRRLRRGDLRGGEPQDHRHAGADRAGRGLHGAGHARHHGPARAVARGAGQPGVGHDVGDRDVDQAAHGGRGRGAASHRAGDRARFGDQRRHAHGRSAAGRHRLRMAGHEGRLHLHRAGPVRRRLRTGGPRPSAGRRRLDLLRIPAEIAEGLAFAWTKPTILLVWGITVVTNAFAFAYSGLVAPLGISAFHVSPALVGLLAAAEPIGALAGGALIAAGVVRMDRRLTFAGGAALFMVALIVMALSPSYWLAFAVLVLGGFGTAGFGNMQTTLMLTEAPPDMRSRLMGMVTVGIGTGPLGVLAAGVIATEFGPRTAVLVMATTGLLFTAALTIWLRRRAASP